MREGEQDVLSVTGLVQYLTRVINEDPGLSRVWVQGEISNFKHHGRGHMYFTLKDDQTRIRAVMFAGNNRRLRFMPKDGDEVLIRGQIGVFERDGLTQLYVTHMQPNGMGELYVSFQRLKEKLNEEGLFSTSLKKGLPFFPRCVGVITSAHGAAVRDIITTIRRRNRGVDVLLYPVSVQGPQAPLEIAQALDQLNRAGEVDVIIVGRGGRSWRNCGLSMKKWSPAASINPGFRWFRQSDMKQTSPSPILRQMSGRRLRQRRRRWLSPVWKSCKSV